MNASPHNLHLFQPHLLLPSQVDRSVNLTGAQALLEAIIDDALKCVRGISTGLGRRNGSALKVAKRRVAHDTLDWFLSDTELPYSFLYCCLHLKVDPRPFRAWAKCMFEKIPLPPVMPPPSIRPYARVWPNKTRHALKQPSWGASVSLRWSNKNATTIKDIKLERYGWSKEEARAICQEYIDGGAWRQFIEPQKEAA